MTLRLADSIHHGIGSATMCGVPLSKYGRQCMLLGTHNPEMTYGSRDAAHVPCVLVYCDHALRPGDSLKFVVEFTKVELSHPGDRHGVVDVFLKEPYIPPGKQFWMMLQPELVGDKLMHVFEIKSTKAMPFIIDPEDDYDTNRCKREGC